MNRDEAFALEFENETMKIVAAGFEDKIDDFVVYCKEDDVDEYDGGRSAEFLLKLADAKVLNSVFDQNVNVESLVFENKALKIAERHLKEEYAVLEVTDDHNRMTPITLFDTDAALLLKALI